MPRPAARSRRPGPSTNVDARAARGSDGARRSHGPRRLALLAFGIALTNGAAPAFAATLDDVPAAGGADTGQVADPLPAAIPAEDRGTVAGEIAAVMAATPPGRRVRLELPSGARLSVLLGGIRTGAHAPDCRSIEYRYEGDVIVAARGERCRALTGQWGARAGDTPSPPAARGDAGAATGTPPRQNALPTARLVLPRPRPERTWDLRAVDFAGETRVLAMLAELSYLPSGAADAPHAEIARGVGEFVNDEALSFPLSEQRLLVALESAVARKRALGDCVPRGGPALCLRAGAYPASPSESIRR